jgi:calcineurin-like phosphoesterase family protein
MRESNAYGLKDAGMLWTTLALAAGGALLLVAIVFGYLSFDLGRRTQPVTRLSLAGYRQTLVLMHLLSALGFLAVACIVIAYGSYNLRYPSQTVQGSPALLANWVQVVAPARCVAGPSVKQPAAGTCAPHISARLIVPRDATCPSVTIGGTPVATVDRPPDVKRAKAFEAIKLCVADHAGTDTVEFPDGTKIPVRPRQIDGSVDRLAIFGDTGCREGKQACTGDNWPFEKIASKVAEDSPDLVVHLGDYLYTKSDTWNDWRKYFFLPAALLLKTTPWLVMRGNHENFLDENQWAGFEYFFGGQDRLRMDNPAEIIKPYAIDLSAKLRVIVADSSASYASGSKDWLEKRATSKDLSSADCDTWPGDDKGNCNGVKAQLLLVESLMPTPSESPPEVWLMTHVPVFGLEHEEEIDKKTNLKQMVDRIPKSSAMMLSAWMQNRVAGINRIFSGDRHLLQVITPKGQPIQISVGTGGVNLDDFPKTLDRLIDLDIGLERASATGNVNVPPSTDQWCSYQGHGYLWADRKGTADVFKFVPVPTPTAGGIDLCANRINHGLASAAPGKR